MTDDDLPEMIPVESSNVEAYGHDSGRSELHVRFKGGGHYVYHNVDPSTVDDLRTADSIGTFIHKRVKGRHDCRRL